jgi:hypothetical protein
MIGRLQDCRSKTTKSVSLSEVYYLISLTQPAESIINSVIVPVAEGNKKAAQTRIESLGWKTINESSRSAAIMKIRLVFPDVNGCGLSGSMLDLVTSTLQSKCIAIKIANLRKCTSRCIMGESVFTDIAYAFFGRRHSTCSESSHHSTRLGNEWARLLAVPRWKNASRENSVTVLIQPENINAERQHV